MMMYNNRIEYGCTYGCCRSLNKKRGQNWHRLLRTREKRAWMGEVWA